MAEIKLTKDQWAAVHIRGGNLLVSAAAGSGKTKVLVDRLMAYLCDPEDPANIDDFLIITYTKAAASELRGKISSELSQRLAAQPENRHLQKQMQRIYLAKISTVHAFCGDLLREFACTLGLPGDFRVAEENEMAELRQQALDATLEEAYQKIDQEAALQAFVNTLGLGRDDRSVPQLIQKVYDSARCHLRPEAWLLDCEEKAGAKDAAEPGQTPWGAYLLQELHTFLEEEIQTFASLQKEAQADDTLQKAAVVFAKNLAQLEALQKCESWDEVVAGKIVDFGRMAAIRAPSDPMRWEQMKAIRKESWEAVKQRQSEFYGTSQEVLADLRQTGLALSGLFGLVRAFSKRFAQEKERRRLLDFSDLEHKTVSLLLGKQATGPTAAAREIASRFREVMVDEYQDTNQVQDSIFAALTDKRRNCFLVGDVKQSIYRFRLADPGIFREKADAYKPLNQAKENESRKIFLSENFRSGGGVLAAANEVFDCAMSRKVGGVDYGEQERLKEGVPHEPLPQPEIELHCLELSEAEDVEKDQAEAAFVARRIARLLQEETYIRDQDGLRRVQPGDIVILMRSPGSAGGYYGKALAKLGIPCKTGGQEDLLKAPEICVLRSLLQVIDNPYQDIPLLAALGSPVFGFTADRLGKIRGAHPSGSFYEALQEGEDGKGFCRKLERLRQSAKLDTLAGLVQRIWSETGMDTIYRSMQGGEKRLQNLRSFFQKAAAFEERGRKDLQQFLAYLDSLEEKGLFGEEEGDGADAVQLMSIHKSKGLEFPVVILADLARGFNRADLQSSVLIDPELGVGCGVVDKKNRVRYPSIAKLAIARKLAAENLSEELRVLYVAMTRAKDMLIMTCASKRLKGELERIAGQMELPNCPRLSRQAGCLGHWTLMCAMTRTEAGELFALAGRPQELQVRDNVWKIEVHTSGESWRLEPARPVAEAAEALPEEADLQAMGFSYDHRAACLAPSKLTATQLKGRNLDAEAAEAAPGEKKIRPSWRKPAFLDAGKPTGREIGIATHLAMQFIRYEVCGTEEGVAAELRRLEAEEFLTARQAKLVDQKKILHFFATPLGKRLMSGENVLREFKFSLLEPGEKYHDALAGEEIMLQGVVDCCLLEPDGITILDFKTDRVGAAGTRPLAKRYEAQVRAYGEALQRIFKKPVIALYLYFFDGEILESI